MCASKGRTLNHIHLLFHSFSDVKRETETVGHWTERQTRTDRQWTRCHVAVSVKVAIVVFLDPDQSTLRVSTSFFLESSEWKNSCCFLMVFREGRLSGNRS